MKTRASRITLVSLICLALLAAFSTSGAQVPTGPTLPQDAVEAPAQQIAPLRPGALEQPPHSKGFVPPPMDLSHLTGQRMPSVSVLQSLPSSWDWRAQGKVTLVKNQDACGSCYSFAAIANIESKMLIDGAGTFDFSENNAKECNWYELTNTAGGTSCSGGNYDLLANLFSKKGTVLESCDPYVASDVACKSGCPYQKTLLDWRIISGDAVPNTDVLKQYIYQYGPVYTSLYAGDGDAWETELQNYDGSYTLYYTGSEMPNHAVFIVGWDDSLSHTGGNGGWIVKNSWGTSWGDNGYFYIAYGSASIGKYSSFMYDWQDYDPTGDIMYYDEGGWSVSRGYGDTTAWGLAVFTSTVNTNITRVEFWTTDATTDVDVYIYDDFDGSAPTNLLRQSLDHSYNEAGYHSVPLALPLPVPAGNDVIAVVQFTNAVYPYPIPCDRYGPQETGRTYISHSGASGSWSASLYDVAIRLRTSSALAPDVGITKRVIGSDFAPGDPIAFTLTIANSGSEVAAHVVVTDVVPTEVLTPTFASTLALTPTGVLSYVWNVEPLGVGESGVITIYGWIDPGLGSGFSFTNTAIISDPEDNAPGNNTSTVTVGERKVYLPLVVRKYPPPPPSTFYSVGDACVLEGYPTTNLGNTSDMWAGYDDYLSPDGKIARSLIQFDVSAIPSGTSINSAVLRVYLVSSYDYPDKTRTITTYRIGSVWSESSATWNTHPSFAEAYGSASVTHGAWGWYSFDVTDLVRGWVNGTLSNYGVMLRGPEVSGYDSSWRGFSTREGPYTPELDITYSGYTASADAWLGDESVSAGQPARAIIEVLTGSLNASLCQDQLHPLAGEKCLALP